MILAGGVAGVVVGLAGVYGIATLTGNAAGDVASNVTCRPAVELAKKLAPLARGEVAAVNIAKSPLKLPDLSFQDVSGKPLTLAHWRGRTVLLNLWAYWCGPCADELPALAEYQRRMGDRITVLTVHQDENETAGLLRLAELGVRLPTLQDGRRSIAAALKVPNVMPATVVLASDGSVAEILPRPFTDADEIAAAVNPSIGVPVG